MLMKMKMCRIDLQENIYQKWLFWLQLVRGWFGSEYKIKLI